MLLRDIVRLLFHKSLLTGFNIFQDYFYFLLKICGVENILREVYLVDWSIRIRLLVISLLLFIGEISASLVVWNYRHDVEAVITGIISMIMVFQVACKFAELIMHGEKHMEMIKTVGKKTQELQDDPDFHLIGVSNFNRARFYITISTVSYLTALASCYLYPLYAFLGNHEFKLIANVELPGTRNKEPKGWLINYVWGILLSGFTALIILGKDFNVRSFSSFNCFISL